MQVDQSKNGEVTTLALTGRLDAATSGPAQDEILRVIEAGASKLIIDLANLDYVSSAGLRIFITAGKKVKAASGKLVFCNLQDYTKELFEIAGFNSLFTIYPTHSEALQAFIS